MSILHVPHYSHTDSHESGLSHLLHTLRTMGAALFAAKPAVKTAVVPVAAPKKADRASLFRVARSYEDLSPNLAAELRYIGRQ